MLFFGRLFKLLIDQTLNMELLNSHELSLGLEPFDVLGFDSEDHLNQELLKLIQPRSEFIKNVKINQTKS